MIGNRLTDNHLHKADQSETYSYDSAQRFTNYQRGVIGSTPVFTQSYTLDALANWTTFNNNGTNQSRTHDATNAITSLGSQAITNDSKGNQLNKDGKTYYWDKLNRLIEIRNASNVLIAAYYYNTNNLRVQKTTSTGTEQYYYCGARVCVETNGLQIVTKEYIHGGQYIDEIITVITGGTPYFYLYDLRYNMYAMVDDLANVLERARYEGYGKQELMDANFNLVSTPLVDQPFSYTGQRLDTESGLQYYRARYFDNDLGRFISRDPIGYVDGMGLYNGYYVPIGVDPFGLNDWNPKLDANWAPNPDGLNDGEIGYSMHITFTVPNNVPYEPVRVLQVNKINWIGITDKCEIKSGDKYIVDLPGERKIGSLVEDHLQGVPPPGNDKYCMYLRVVEKTIGTGEKGKTLSGIRETKASYDFVKSKLKPPISTLTYSYLYVNSDNCKCCKLLPDNLKLEIITMGGVGSWQGTF